MGIAFDGISDGLTYTTDAPVTIAPLSMMCWARSPDWSNDLGSGDRLFSLNRAGNNNNWWALEIENPGASNQLAFHPKDGAGAGGLANSGAQPSDDAWHCIIGTDASGGASHKIYVDSTTAVENTTSKTPDNIDNIDVAQDQGGGDRANVELAELAIWEAELSTSEIAMLIAGFSPLLVRPQDLVFYAPLYNTSHLQDVVGARTLTIDGAPTNAGHPAIYGPTGLANVGAPAPAAGGGVNETPPHATLEIAANAPAITSGNAPAPPQAQAILQALAPTAIVGANAQASAGTLALASLAPVARVSQLPAPGAASLELGASAPAVIVGANTQANAGALIINAFAPSVAGGGVNVAPGVGVLALASLAPVPVVGQVLTPTQAPLAISGLAPEALAGNLITPTDASVVISGLAPTPVAGHVLSPAQAQMLLQAQAPAIASGNVITPSQAQLLLQGQAPTIVIAIVAVADERAIVVQAEDRFVLVSEEDRFIVVPKKDA